MKRFIITNLLAAMVLPMLACAWRLDYELLPVPHLRQSGVQHPSSASLHQQLEGLLRQRARRLVLVRCRRSDRLCPEEGRRPDGELRAEPPEVSRLCP